MALNNIGAQYEGGQGVPENYAEAARWYRKAVEAGEPIAMVDLGWLYETGHGVAKRLRRGVSAVRRDQGRQAFGDEQSRPALHHGKGVAAIMPGAPPVRTGHRAGSRASMNSIGAIYSEGDGVRRDLRSPREWFEKAAALGDPEARQNLR